MRCTRAGHARVVGAWVLAHGSCVQKLAWDAGELEGLLLLLRDDQAQRLGLLVQVVVQRIVLRRGGPDSARHLHS